ncbi:MAG: hypothetical protein OXC11_11485 [Rhodospirillales bacterium]|nr:hypothetical protein [Rhodospirillales bacterium]
MSDSMNLLSGPGGIELSPGDTVNQMLEFARVYRRHGESRAEPGPDPYAVLTEMGIDVPSGVEVRVSVNTQEDFHLVFPPDPNTALSDEMLGSVAGGSTAGTASSIGCAGSASSLPSCAFSVSSAGTAGTAGSAG